MLAEVDYAESQSTISGRRIPGAFPRSETSGGSRAADSDTQRRQRNGQPSHIRMVTPDNEAPSDRDRVPLSEFFADSPNSEFEDLMRSTEVDSQWRRDGRPESNEAHLPSFLRDLPDDQWVQPSGVDSDQWRRIGSPDTYVRLPPHALQSDVFEPSHWEPPSQPIASLLKRAKTKGPEPRQQVPGPNLQAEPPSGPGPNQRRQTAVPRRLPQSPAVGPSSAQQRSSIGHENQATGAPPGAPTGPRRAAALPDRRQNQTNVPARRDDRRVAFDLAPDGRSPRVEPIQPQATTREPRRRATSGGNHQVPPAAKSPPQTPPSSSRASRQASSNANKAAQPTIPTTTAVRRTSPVANMVTQQQPAASPLNPQQDAAPEPRKRRTRTRSRRKKDPVWTAVCSKRTHIIVVIVSLLLLVALLVVILKIY